MQNEEHWDLIIKPKNKWYQIDLNALWRYRDLLMLLVRRDFVAVYKQTILGPLWLFIQPILTSLIFAIIFGKFAKISTDGAPPIVFYMAGITFWTYFADCLNKTSNTFVANAGVFGKVYFPRLIIPLSVLVSNLIKLGIQLSIFLIIWGYHLRTSTLVNPNWNYMWLVPVLILILAGLGLGFGVLISSLTTKYRDLTFLIGFGIQLLMYGSSVVLPISILPDSVKEFILYNPLVPIIETFRFIFIGSGSFEGVWLFYSFGFMLGILIVAVVIFNKVEKSFMDSV
jgi:lipopolysaccharide transport system permease protein